MQRKTCTAAFQFQQEFPIESQTIGIDNGFQSI
jgi:hypothetical protein